MAIFPDLFLESVIQENDKTRLDATKSFTSKDEAAVSLVEIEAEASAGFIDVTGSSSKDWYLDWEYATDGSKTVSVRITTDGAPTTSTDTITAVTADDDKLFSNDQDLFGIIERKELIRLLEDGKSSFLNYHRKAQEEILDEIDANGIFNSDGTKITKEQIVISNDVKQWSVYTTLKRIYDDKSNSVDDKFDQRSKTYKSRADFYKERSVYRIDFNKDGVVTSGEKESIRSSRLIRA